MTALGPTWLLCRSSQVAEGAVSSGPPPWSSSPAVASRGLAGRRSPSGQQRSPLFPPCTTGPAKVWPSRNRRGRSMRKPLEGLATRVVLGLLHLHQAIYEITDGRVGHGILGVPCLLLRTTGRRTGKCRTSSLVYAVRARTTSWSALLGERIGHRRSCTTCELGPRWRFRWVGTASPRWRRSSDRATTTSTGCGCW